MPSAIIITVVLMLADILSAADLPVVGPNDTGTKITGTYVMLVTGLNKDPEERQAKDKAILRLRKFFLSEANVPADHITVLVDKESFVVQRSGESTAESIRSQLGELARRMKASDRFIFYYVGQANVVKDNLRLNLPGDDITEQDLQAWFKDMQTASMLIVLDCPAAGLAAAVLKGRGRVIVCGSRGDQRYSTRFSDYFVPALSEQTSDANGDGRISLLEAFTAASKRIDDLYREQDLMKTETPLIEDDGDGVPSQEPWDYEKGEHDGFVASRFFFSAT